MYSAQNFTELFIFISRTDSLIFWRLLSSGMRYHVVWHICRGFSEVYVASINRANNIFPRNVGAHPPIYMAPHSSNPHIQHCGNLQKKCLRCVNCIALTLVHWKFSNLLHTPVCLSIQHIHLVSEILIQLPVSRQQPNILANTNSTWCSHAVTHSSTNHAQGCLKTAVRWETLLSTLHEHRLWKPANLPVCLGYWVWHQNRN
jgi:hypothetical protein